VEQMPNEAFMRRALRLARRGRTSPNPMVGAVVVNEGRIVGEGYHPRAGESHAEVLALGQASELAKGAELYVSLEPCCHHRRTPPCTDAVLAAGIRKVYAAMVDPDPKVGGRGVEILRSAGIQVQVGLLGAQAAELNRGYIKRITTGMPFVLWKAAMTLDGKIATRTGDSRWVTGEKARRCVHRLRSRSDAILTGVGTILADDPELTARGTRGRPDPVIIVADSTAATPPTARILNSDARTIIAVTGAAPEEKVEALRTAGAEVLILPKCSEGVDLCALLARLGRLGLNEVLLEGGGRIAASALRAGLVDRGLVFIAPKIIGGQSAPTPVEGAGIELMSRALAVSKPKIRRFGEDIALEFDVTESLDTSR